MFFLKQTTTLLLIVAFTQAFAQELNSKRFYSDDIKNTEYLNPAMDNLSESEREGSMHLRSLELNGNELLVMVSDIPKNDDDEMVAEPIKFLAPSAEATYKKGKMIEIRWTGGSPEDEFALDLFDGRFHYRHIGELKNSGIYPWIIPKDVDPGKEYKFKLTNTEDFGEYTFSESFIIKRKVPIAVWIVPGALVVGGAAYLLFRDNSSGELSDLPTPIDPE